MRWLEDAACRGRVDVDFFAADPGPALAVCAACRVRGECADWAAAERIRFGVFGGLTPAERRGGRRRPGREQRAPAGQEKRPRPRVRRAAKARPVVEVRAARVRRNDGPCSSCGKRAASTKGLCHACYNRRWWREREAALARTCECGAAIALRSARCRSCAGRAWRAQRRGST